MNSFLTIIVKRWKKKKRLSKDDRKKICKIKINQTKVKDTFEINLDKNISMFIDSVMDVMLL